MKAALFFAFLAGIAFANIVNAVLLYLMHRVKRRQVSQRDYFDPCGPECQIRGTSHLGMDGSVFHDFVVEADDGAVEVPASLFDQIVPRSRRQH
ncbi:MAG: hypothetical protein WC538_21980 [Thermoanaerobaculia bacterium]|jgi:hypothetical protein